MINSEVNINDLLILLDQGCSNGIFKLINGSVSRLISKHLFKTEPQLHLVANEGQELISSLIFFISTIKFNKC